MPNGVDLKFDMPTDAELKQMFDMVPKLNHYKVSDQVLRAGSMPIVRKAREKAPRGDIPKAGQKVGSSKKRSKKQRGEAKWDTPLHTTIDHVVRKYQAGGVAVIGPRWPEGNKAYFNTSPKGRREFLWGMMTGRVVPQIRNWIVQAFDETQPEQLSAMKSKLATVIDRMFRSK